MQRKKMQERLQRMRVLIRLFSIALLTCVSAVIVHANSAQEVIRTIESAYKAGTISLDEKVLLQVNAIRHPEKLPAKYSVTTLSTSRISQVDARSATFVLRDIMQEYDLLSPATQQALSTALTRYTTAFSIVSPGGFFRIHYDTTGANAVSSVDLNANAIPDFVEQCASYCDTTYNMFLSLGYLMPPSDGGLGGDTLYDVYFQDMGYHGYAVPEGSGSAPWNDSYSHLVLNNTFIGFPFNNDPEGNIAGAAKVTCAHEFYHAVQFAYDPTEPVWWMESSATWMEDVVFDQTDDNYNYLGSFFSAPDKSLLENTGHAYSSFIWESFLAQKFDTSLMRAVMEGARYSDVFTTLADSLQGIYGWTIDSAMTEFAVWNYITSVRDDGLHHTEASFYPGIFVGQSHYSYPATLLSSPTNPTGYGSCYIEFFPTGDSGHFEISFNGDDARQWSAYLIKSTSDNVHQIQQINLTPGAYTGVDTVLNIHDYYRVTLVGVNLSENQGGAFFTYSANIYQPFAVSSAITTIDSSVYSGGLRYFDYEITNPSPLWDLFHITAYDDSGWVLPDTQAISLGPDSSRIVQIAVTPPDATPIGSISSLVFHVWSDGDPMVVDTQYTGAKAVLQRGDVDFDGDIFVSDLTYLVTYLFKGGPVPLPSVTSGDFSCNSSVDVDDLTALVQFLFQSGPQPACNPY